MTAVGGGNFSSPVTVSLRESSNNNLISPVVIITVTLVIALLMSSLLVTSTLVYICWYVIVQCGVYCTVSLLHFISDSNVQERTQ